MITAPSSALVAGTPVPIPAPAVGSLAVGGGGSRVIGAGTMLATLDAERSRPIGSVAKTMTALVTLDVHPLEPGGDGPVYTITADDVALFHAEEARDGSRVTVAAGERFTERQLLLALLLPSANNIAETLARWAGGTRDAFVGRLNARAEALGMGATHFVDPSGFDPATRASASDLVRLGRAALASPALADLVRTVHATLPDGTAIDNLDSLLRSEPGWLGIKTGETPQAGGCLLFAARRLPVGGADPADAVTVVGAVLGQPDLAAALRAAAAAAGAAIQGYRELDAAALTPSVTGTLTPAWGAAVALGLAAPVVASPSVLRIGSPVALVAVSEPRPAPLDRGAAVGHLEAVSGGVTLVTWDVVSGDVVAAPDWVWRLEHG